MTISTRARVLALAALAATLMVFRGVRGGWILLALTAVGALAALLMLALVLGALGATAEMWSAVVLTVGPIGCLVLALGRPVREWTGPAGTRRSAGGRRGRARSH